MKQAQNTDDIQQLETILLEKIKATYLEIVPQVVEDLRGLANFVRTGAPFRAENTKQIATLLNEGCFIDGVYGLELTLGDGKLRIEIRVLNNRTSYPYVSTAFPGLEGVSSKFFAPYAQEILTPHIEKLFAEGVFEGLFADALGIWEKDSGLVLFKHIYNPKAAEKLKEEALLLETSKDWEKNAELLPVVVPKLKDGIFLPADNERALQIVLRHMYSPQQKAQEAAELLLRDYTNPHWLYTCALIEHDNGFFVKVPFWAERAGKASGGFNYEPSLALLEKIEIAKQRIEKYEKLAGIPSEKEPITENDLFLETKNIIIRAYKSGDIVLRFLVESEAAYGEALDFVNALLQKGYAYKTDNWANSGGFAWHIRFLCKPVWIEQMTKIKNQKGISYPLTDAHAFFAKAVQYPSLREKVEHYAELALHKFHWYTDLQHETNTVPGTFAATALAFCGLEYMHIVCNYARSIDDEHTYIQLPLAGALVKHYGAVPKVIPAVYALCTSNGQDGDMKLPKDLLAAGENAEALLDYVLSGGMELFYAIPMMMYKNPKQNLKKLGEYYLAADCDENKNSIAKLHNLYLQEVIDEEGGKNLPKPLPIIEMQALSTSACNAQKDKTEEDIDGPIVSAEYAANHGMDVAGMRHFDVKVGFYCSPSVYSNMDFLAFSRQQWENVTFYNENKENGINQVFLVSGAQKLRLGKWVLDTSRLAQDFAMVLFDGKTKPMVLYGLYNAPKAMTAFVRKDPKTLQEAEELCRPYLCFPSPEKENGEETAKAEAQLDEITAAFLYCSFSAAENQLRPIKPTEKLAYITARVMLAYLTQQRGQFEEMAELCDELAQLLPDQKDYWLEKMNLESSKLFKKACKASCLFLKRC